jgi:hypothetical protein
VIAATVIALLVLPLLVLRGRTLAAYYAVDAATWLFAWLLWRSLPPFDPYLAFVTVAVGKGATLSLFLACGRKVRWSANRAALMAAIVYALMIPAMLRTPIDGDEPFYLLQTDSMASDFDLDLANQYRARAGASWGREDLGPQFGDPRGEGGEEYSRHEPFLAVLLLPGYLLGGLHGAIATIALFGVLLVRSTLRWMEDEGVSDDSARAVFPLFALAPPVLFYATRIWPEVPAAFFFVEALRGLRAHRARRWLPALFGLVMLKLRFVLVALGLALTGLPAAKGWWARRHAAGHGQKVTVYATAAAIIVILPLLVVAMISGSVTNVHTWGELVPMNPMRYLVGLGGLLVDGMSGIAFQAPFYLFGLFAVTRWKATPNGFRTGLLASLLYLFYLLPRGEWFGGWAPPLRYVVFLMPVLALGIAAVWNEIPRAAIAVVALWTTGLVIHGLTYPWRLFHEFTGENAVGEWLSRLHHSDFSRLFPSFIRVNEAAWWGLGVLLVLLAAAAFTARNRDNARKPAGPLLVAIVALGVALGFHYGRNQPGATVQFEDAHVLRDGGRIYPDPYTVMRATYQGGWVLDAGHSLSFLAREGTHTLHFITGLGATFDVAGSAYTVRPDERYQTVRIRVPRSGRVTLRCLSGAINVDRMDRDD